MKKSINAWSVKEDVTFEEMFRQIKEAGFDGIELNVDKTGFSAHSLTLETTAEELASIKSLSEQVGLPVVSISTSVDSTMGIPDPACREFATKLITQQLFCAKALGAKGILVVPGGISPEVSIKQAYQSSFETLLSMKDIIQEYRINVGVENVWNGFFMSPFDMADFIERLDCPYIGAYYDVGNCVAFSWSEYWIEILGSKIRNVHIKDFKRNHGIHSGGAFVDLMKGDVNWKGVIPALKNAGFDGYLTAEVFIDDSDLPDVTYESFYQAVAEQIGVILANFGSDPDRTAN